jgi:hypothetical protein
MISCRAIGTAIAFSLMLIVAFFCWVWPTAFAAEIVKGIVLFALLYLTASIVSRQDSRWQRAAFLGGALLSVAYQSALLDLLRSCDYVVCGLVGTRPLYQCALSNVIAVYRWTALEAMMPVVAGMLCLVLARVIYRPTRKTSERASSGRFHIAIWEVIAITLIAAVTVAILWHPTETLLSTIRWLCLAVMLVAIAAGAARSSSPVIPGFVGGVIVHGLYASNYGSTFPRSIEVLLTSIHPNASPLATPDYWSESMLTIQCIGGIYAGAFCGILSRCLRDAADEWAENSIDVTEEVKP